jgi:hypothetical protein
MSALAIDAEMNHVIAPVSRDDCWAWPVAALAAPYAPAGAINLNVAGRRVVGPLQGFGQLWQKTYRVRLHGAGVTPAEVMRVWKEHFKDFWPRGNHFYPSLTGIAPGEVALLDLAMPGGARLSTGMLVIYADDESFTLMTPQGHMESGWITFSAYVEDGVTVAQVESLARANDPFFEVGFLVFAHRTQERFWQQTLRSLAARFGVDGRVWMARACLDPDWQWSYAWNAWHNAAIRTALYLAAAPLRALGGARRG